jgi:hypothetical protein
LLFLLGDYGAGKTSFSRHLAYSLLREKYVDKNGQRLTPVLISLRDSRGRLDLKSVIVESLAGLYGVDIQSFAAFERLCSTGNVLLLLDGFDEMTDRSDAETLIDAFNQIYVFAALNAKVLLTCRSNFFRSHADIIGLLKRFSITIPLQEESQLLELPLKDHGKVLYLEKLSPAQIREFIEKRFGAKADEMLAAIQRIHDLSDLSTRPVLLDMIVSTLPELEKAKSRINSAALYEHYTARWTTRDQWRVTIPLKVRTAFCESLAWSMHCANANGIPYSLLEQMMVNTLSVMTKDKEQLEKFKNDIQTCSFLVRIGEQDEFRFAHKSFGEFFVARKLVDDLSAGIPIERSAVAKLFPQPKPSLVVDTAFLFNNIGNVSSSSILEYVRSGLNDKIKSSRLFLSMKEAEVASTWGYISSDASVRAHFEAEIRAVFSKQWLTKFSDEISISEEIATFAVEHMANVGLGFEQITNKDMDAVSVNVVCDIVRLAKSVEWVQQNSDALKSYVSKGKHPNLKIACMAALTAHPNAISVEFVRDARKTLSPEGWSYILFALATTGDRYKDVLSTLLRDEQLAPVDQVICVYGVGGKLPFDDENEKTADLISSLLRSDNSKERSLAASVLRSLGVEKRIAILSKAFREARGKATKSQLVELLGETTDPAAWRTLRGLAATETDPDIKASLRAAETMLRTAASQRQDRAGWDRVKNNRAVREAMWASRR